MKKSNEATTAKKGRKPYTILTDTIARSIVPDGHVQTNVVSVVVELLPDATKARRPQHHPAMRWQDVPDFVKNVLRLNRTGSSRPLLEWLILTSARSGESRNLTWDQIDMENAIWNIPPDNTKMDRLHNVPLASPPSGPIWRLSGRGKDQSAQTARCLAFPAFLTIVRHDFLGRGNHG